MLLSPGSPIALAASVSCPSFALPSVWLNILCQLYGGGRIYMMALSGEVCAWEKHNTAFSNLYLAQEQK